MAAFFVGLEREASNEFRVAKTNRHQLPAFALRNSSLVTRF